MGKEEHFLLLRQGVDSWNQWRIENRGILPDLSGATLREASLLEADLHDAVLLFADLKGANLTKANLSQANLLSANLTGATLTGANLNSVYLTHANLTDTDLTSVKLGGMANFVGANLTNAKLAGADFSYSYFTDANLTGVNLTGANLTGANLARSNLTEANLTGANLTGTHLVQTDFTRADLTGCRIYGVSAWGLKLDATTQQDLIITTDNEPAITVDNIEVAQFIYLLLHNQKIRDVIDTVTSKAVLILGRFTAERKSVLDAIREELRKRDYLPILFDFEKPISVGTDETITLLARMAKFIIADISDAKAVLQELRAIVPDLPSVPVQPIIRATQEESDTFDFYRNRPSFLSVYRYTTQEQLLVDLDDKVIRPAELKLREFRGGTAYKRC